MSFLFRVRCHTLPKVPNGFVVGGGGGGGAPGDQGRPAEHYYGDQARVECHRGYTRIGSNIISCGAEGEFSNVPTCQGEFSRVPNRARNG